MTTSTADDLYKIPDGVLIMRLEDATRNEILRSKPTEDFTEAARAELLDTLEKYVDEIDRRINVREKSLLDAVAKYDSNDKKRKKELREDLICAGRKYQQILNQLALVNAAKKGALAIVRICEEMGADALENARYCAKRGHAEEGYIDSAKKEIQLAANGATATGDTETMVYCNEVAAEREIEIEGET